MGTDITGKWWALAIRGVAAILFGLAAFLWPGLTLFVLVLLVGAYLVVDGVLALVAGGMTRSWLLLIEGAASVIAGILAFVWPSITAIVLLALVAAWAVITGAIEIYAAIHLRRIIKNEWLLVLGGAASVLFGILLIINPRAGLLAVTWLVGLYALIFGVVLVALALRLRNSRRPLDALRPSI